jgi:hypothetical protein
MNPETNQPKIIDFLSLSDAEKVACLKESRKYLKQQLEEAKFWRTLAENDQRLLQELQGTFEESNVPDFLRAENEDFT